MIFEDAYIREGEVGGRTAATELHNRILRYAYSELRDTTVNKNTKVICRAYVNVQGLAPILVSVGAADSQDTVKQFFVGFTQGKLLFDFVDVGPGKDRADAKIIGSSTRPFPASHTPYRPADEARTSQALSQ